MKTVKLNNSVFTEDWVDAVIKYGQPTLVDMHPDVFDEMLQYGLVDPTGLTGVAQPRGTFMDIPVYVNYLSDKVTTAEAIVCSGLPIPEEELRKGSGHWPDN